MPQPETRRFLRPSRPSPAMVVALTALVVALGGTSYAATQLPHNSVGPSQLRANAVTGPKIKSGTIQQSDLSSPVSTAIAGATGARAYANYTAAGALDGDNKNMGGVKLSQLQPGVYCATGLGVNAANIIVSIDAVGSDLGATVQGTIGGLDLCPAGTQFEVQTYNQTGARAPEPFYIALN